MQTSLGSKTLRAALTAALLISQIPISGCGKEPMTPLAKSSTTLKGPAGRTPNELPPDDDNGQPGGSPYPQNFVGGPATLPVGPAITKQQVRAKADSLLAFQVARDNFLARGYIYHSEMDSTVVNGLQSSTFYFFAKPGKTLGQATAVISVMTVRMQRMQTVQVIGWPGDPPTGGWHTFPLVWFETQVRGGLIVHTTQDSIAFVDNNEDPAIIVTGLPPATMTNSFVIGDTVLVSSGGWDPNMPGEWGSGWDSYSWDYGEDGQWHVTVVSPVDSWRDTANHIGEGLRDEAIDGAVYVVYGALLGLTLAYLIETNPNPELLRKAVLYGAGSGAGDLLFDYARKK